MLSLSTKEALAWELRKGAIILGGTGGGIAGEVTPELGLDSFASGRKGGESILG